MTNEELKAKIREFKELQVFIKQLSDEADAVKADIISEMEAQQTDTLSIDIFTVKYTAYQNTRLDSVRFKQEHGDLYNAYVKTTEARRFSVA